MEVFVVRWDDDGADLDAVFSSMPKAQDYVNRQLERMECFNILESFVSSDCAVMRFRYGEDGASGMVAIETMVVDMEP